MRAHMPRKKIISMILKYVCVYLAIAIVAGWIATTALYNNLIQYEWEARKSGFQLSLDSCQEYLDKSRLPIRDCLAMIYARAFVAQADFNIFQDHLPLEVRAYVALEDPETKEILADNGENVFFIVRFYDGEEVEESSVEGDQYEPKIMYSPVAIFEEGYLALREGQASLKGWLGERVRSKATWEEFYNEETIRCVLLDFYQKGDGSILPGKVLLLRREGKNWRFNSKVAIDPDSVEAGDQIVADLTPANMEGYDHLEAVETNNDPSKNYVNGYMIWSPKNGNADEGLRARAVEAFGHTRAWIDAYACQTEGFLFPGKACFVMDGTIRDWDGNTLRLCQYVEVGNFFWGYMQLIGWCYIAIYGISLILFLVILRHALLKKKYAYEQECYRKMLVDIMAHDLKTPLTAAGGYAESLKEHLHTDKMEYYAEELQKNIAYMNEIISSNLAISRREFEKKKLQRKSVDLVELCQKSVEKQQASALEKKCTFAVNGKTVVRGDSEMLERVFDNLIVNAVKYAVPESEIQVTGKGRQISIQNVTDQELEGNLKRLWEPFVRGDESRSGEKGTGIGLYIAAKILDDHKWKYSIHYDKTKKVYECVIKIPWGVLF